MDVDIAGALDHIQSVQEDHGEILIRLEQRPIVDIDGLARRLEEIADTLVVLPPPEQVPVARWKGLLAGVLLLLCGWVVCWATVQWLPSGALPPGFSRPEPLKKGKF